MIQNTDTVIWRWEFPPEKSFEWSDDYDYRFDPVKIWGQEYTDFKTNEISILRKLLVKGIKVPELYLFVKFTLTDSHIGILSERLAKYLWKFVEVIYANWDVGKGILKIEKNPFFDDFSAPWNQLRLDNGVDYRYISYFDMLNGINIRIIKGFDSNLLKNKVSWRIDDVFGNS